MAIDYNVLGQRLRNARKEKNITLEELAKKIEVSVTYLSRMENGSTKISLKRVMQISKILEITPGEILTGISCKSKEYLSEEFNEIMKNCSPEKQKAILNIAKLIMTM